MTPEAVVELLRRTKATLNVDYKGYITIQTVRGDRVVTTNRYAGQLTEALDEHAKKVLQ